MRDSQHVSPSIGNADSTALEDEAAVLSTVDQWLESLGLHFDPFRTLNASEDERLHEYLVAHETFEAIRADDVSFVFTPAGGGKSAFRVRLARACRVGENGRRLFPIVYMVPEAEVLATEANRLQAHVRAILQAAAFELLLRLAYRPHEFTNLNLSTRQIIRFLLERSLPSPLSHLLAQLATPADLPRLARSYDATARWPKPPDAETLHNFRRAMEETPPLPEQAAPADEFDAWLALFTGPLHFEAVYLLVDGVDAFPETVQDAEEALALLSPLLERAGEWARESLLLKAFLPLELKSVLKESFPLLTSQASSAIIQWTSDLLIDLLRRRMEAATETAPASLDMLCHPGLRGVDNLVIQAVEPLPREVLVFVERMFLEHVQRVGPIGKLTRKDVEAADQWYMKSRPLPNRS